MPDWRGAQPPFLVERREQRSGAPHPHCEEGGARRTPDDQALNDRPASRARSSAHPSPPLRPRSSWRGLHLPGGTGGVQPEVPANLLGQLEEGVAGRLLGGEADRLVLNQLAGLGCSASRPCPCSSSIASTGAGDYAATRATPQWAPRRLVPFAHTFQRTRHLPRRGVRSEGPALPRAPHQPPHPRLARPDGSLWYWGARPGFVAPSYDDNGRAAQQAFQRVLTPLCSDPASSGATAG